MPYIFVLRSGPSPATTAQATTLEDTLRQDSRARYPAGGGFGGGPVRAKERVCWFSLSLGFYTEKIGIFSHSKARDLVRNARVFFLQGQAGYFVGRLEYGGCGDDARRDWRQHRDPSAAPLAAP